MKENGMELDAIAARYEARKTAGADQRYSWSKPDVYMSAMEGDRAMLDLFTAAGLLDFARLRLIEIGCGSGGNLLRLLRWGFDPANLVGNELLPERLAAARRRLPQDVALIGGDACELGCEGFDIVYQSTVFSSILDEDFQKRLAKRMWEMAKPGGGILWYDFCYDNPRNPDVRGVPVRRIRALFPSTQVVVRRVTLAPPLARVVTRVSAGLYSVFNSLPLLRTHALCWIPKPVGCGGNAEIRDLL